MLVFRAGIHKILVRIANRNSLIRLLHLGLCCLSMRLSRHIVFEIYLKFIVISPGKTRIIDHKTNNDSKRKRFTTCM